MDNTDRKRKPDGTRSPTPVAGGLIGTLSGYFKRARRSYYPLDDTTTTAAASTSTTTTPASSSTILPAAVSAANNNGLIKEAVARSVSIGGVDVIPPSTSTFTTNLGGVSFSNGTANETTNNGNNGKNFGNTGIGLVSSSLNHKKNNMMEGSTTNNGTPTNGGSTPTTITRRNVGFAFSRKQSTPYAKTNSTNTVGFAFSRKQSTPHPKSNSTGTTPNGSRFGSTTTIRRRATPYHTKNNSSSNYNRPSIFSSSTSTNNNTNYAPLHTPQSSARKKRYTTNNNNNNRTPSTLNRRLTFDSQKLRALTPNTKQAIVDTLRNTNNNNPNDTLMGPPVMMRMDRGKVVLGSNQTGGGRLLSAVKPRDIRGLDGETRADVVRGRRSAGKTGAFVERGEGGVTALDDSYWNRGDGRQPQQQQHHHQQQQQGVEEEEEEYDRGGDNSTVSEEKESGQKKRRKVSWKEGSRTPLPPSRAANLPTHSTPHHNASSSRALPPAPSEIQCTQEDLRIIYPNENLLGVELNYAQLFGPVTTEQMMGVDLPDTVPGDRISFPPVKIYGKGSSGVGQVKKIVSKFEIPAYKGVATSSGGDNVTASVVPFSFMPASSTNSSTKKGRSSVLNKPLDSNNNNKLTPATPQPPPVANGWGSMFDMKAGEWKCSVCKSLNQHPDACVACEAPKPADVVVGAGTYCAKPAAVPKVAPTTSTAISFGFGGGGGGGDNWDCAACSANNAEGIIKCMSCGKDKVVGGGSGAASSSSVPKKSGGPSFSFGATPKSSSVPAAEKPKISFGAPPTSSSSSTAAVTGGFSFGLPTTKAPDTVTTVGDNDKNVTKKTSVDTFTFGAAPALSSTTTPAPPADSMNKGKINFSFTGASAATTSSDLSAAPNEPSTKKRKDDVFAFGAAPTSAAKPATLAFGAASTTVAKPSTAPGGATAAPALGSIAGVATKSSTGSGVFSFGASNSGGIGQDPASNMTKSGQGDSALSFKFGSSSNSTAVKTDAEAPNLNFSFGTKTTLPSTTTNNLQTMGGPPSSTPSFSFGAGSATSTTAPNSLMPKHPSNDHLGNTNSQQQQRPSKKRCNDEIPTTATQPPAFAFGATPLPTTTAPTSSNAPFAFGSSPAVPPPAPTPSFPPVGGTAPQLFGSNPAPPQPFGSNPTPSQPFGSNPTPSTASGQGFSFGGGAPTPAATMGGGGGGAPFAFGSNNASMNAPGVTTTGVGAQPQPFATNTFGATPPIPAQVPTMNFGAAVPQQQQQPPIPATVAFGGAAQQPAPATSFGGFGGAAPAGGGFNIGTGGGAKTRGTARRRILRAKRPPSGKR